MLRSRAAPPEIATAAEPTAITVTSVRVLTRRSEHPRDDAVAGIVQQEDHDCASPKKSLAKPTLPFVLTAAPRRGRGQTGWRSRALS
jgi:hypothetical protein